MDEHIEDIQILINTSFHLNHILSTKPEDLVLLIINRMSYINRAAVQAINWKSSVGKF